MTSRTATGFWWPQPKRNSLTNLRLFCFPYAAGNVQIFNSWQDALPATVEVCPIQLPGRGNRLREASFTRLLPLVSDVADDLLPYLHEPFAIFGHSLGAMVAFELARHLVREHSIQPTNLFVSGYPAPQIPQSKCYRYDLTESELIEELRRLNGTPKEVLDHPELMQLLIPMIRADLEMIRTYVYADTVPLSCPITAFGGLQDERIMREDLAAWHMQTTAAFSVRMFRGDHFFIHTSQRLLLQIIARKLVQASQQLSR